MAVWRASVIDRSKRIAAVFRGRRVPAQFCTYFVLILASCCMTTQGYACARSTEGAAFPLHVARDKRFLEDAYSRPFFIQGDSAWSLIAQLTREEADLYLKDRKARGFNTILVSLIEHRFADKAPANIYGDPPFLIEGDYSTPNEAYFKHADWVLRRACELGYLILLAPSYAGAGGGPDGWYQEMLKSGDEKLRGYGRFVGKRYASFENIIWVHGGDYNPPNRSLVRAIVDGIIEVEPNALHTVHGTREFSALDYWPDEPWLSLNNVYTYDPVGPLSLRQFLDSDMPFFLMESAYENEHEAGEYRIRMQAYEAILSGASGHLFGNNPIWHFSGPGIYPVAMSWQEALDSPGARSMTHLHNLISSVKWWLLEPDPDGKLVVGEWGNRPTRSATGLAQDGSFALTYLPAGKGININFQALLGPWISAQWFDPSSGTLAPVEGSPFRAGTTHYLDPKSKNHAGFTDWVLVLTSTQSSGHNQ